MLLCMYDTSYKQGAVPEVTRGDHRLMTYIDVTIYDNRHIVDPNDDHIGTLTTTTSETPFVLRTTITKGVEGFMVT